MSVTNFDQELPNNYIIPSEYYDRYRLIFSHYQIDRKIGRIGLNEKQRRKAKTRGDSDSCRSFGSARETWNSVRIFRETDNLQQLEAISRQIVGSQHLLN